MQQGGRDVSGMYAAQDAAASPAGESGDITAQSEHAWPTAAVLLLIETCRIHKDKFSDSTKKKYEIWRDIAKTLQDKGYAIDGTACDNKMRSLKRRYKAIKDSASLSGRGAQKQWQFYNLMNEMLAESPAIQPVAVEACRPVASTSGISQHQQVSPSPIPPAGASSPSVRSAPSPSSSHAASPLSSPVGVDPPTGDSAVLPPSKKRARKHRAEEILHSTDALKRHNELLESLASAGKERGAVMKSFVESLTLHHASQSDLHKIHQEEKKELQKKIEDLHNTISKLKDEHHKEIRNLQEKHLKDIRELQEKHQQELRQQQDRFWDMRRQHQEQLLQFMLRRDQ